MYIAEVVVPPPRADGRTECWQFLDTWVRIHDSSGFYCRPLLSAWLEIMRTRFYAYTEEVVAFR